jgi:2-polyprenyl-3-methyl-5-hydroxy-6-metoxy-1,4-benzoquinol methylase
MENGYFHTHDPNSENVAGYQLNPSWWSRKWEYLWALQYAKPQQVVMDAGTGWSGRPFGNMLADLGCEVWAVDADPRVLDLPKHNGVKLVVRSFLEQMDDFPRFDVVFCLSVLEDLTKDLPEVLYKFASKLKDDGLLVVTFDTPYDSEKPCPKYPGLNLADFYKAYQSAGLKLRDNQVDLRRENRVHHDEWNLSVCHWVLQHAK